MKVLVTGASGFVGALVVHALVANEHDVISAVRAEPGPRLLRAPHGRIRVLDLELPELLVDVLGAERPEAIVHCAAYGALSNERDRLRMCGVNVLGTTRLFQAAEAARVQRLLHLGTAFEYGTHSEPVSELTAIDPVGDYAASKAAAWLVLREAARRSSVAVAALRLFNVFGPGNSLPRLDAQITQAARTGEPVALSAGDQRRDFLHVDDVAAAVCGLLGSPDASFPRGEAINLARGEPITVRQFAERAAAALGASQLLRFGQAEQRAGAPSDLFTRAERWRALSTQLGLAPPRPLDDALSTLAERME